MNYRILPCLALNERQALYLVQGREGRGRWMNLCEGTNACLFRERGEAEIFVDFNRLADNDFHGVCNSGGA
jgi:hypothetical protein